MEENVKKQGYFKELIHLLKENIRDYGMFIALAIIMVFFTISTGGNFLTPNNLTNLVNQTGYIAVLSIGVTLVIIIRHIDLSIGYVSGFMGALVAIMMVSNGFPVYVALPLVLIIGTIVGMWHGFLVAYMKIPAFVATLAGMFIFRGAIQQTLRSTGTIIIPNNFFRAISRGTIPDFFGFEAIHLTSMLVGALALVAYIFIELNNHKTRIKYNFSVLSQKMLISKMAFIGLLIMLISFVMASHNGITWTLVIVLGVVSVYHIIMKGTVLGRHIYAVGGNPEAAELSGISVKFITMVVFGSMGLLSAVSGIMFASRLGSATVTAGQLFELEAIAGAFVGGVSAAGGVGKVTGSVIGALVMASLRNGLQLMGTASALQYIVQGFVLIAAVIFDVYTRNKA